MHSALRPTHVAFVLLAFGLAAACSSDKTDGTPGDDTDAGGGAETGTGTGGKSGDGVKAVLLDDGGVYCPSATPINDNGTCIALDEAMSACKERSATAVPGTKTDDPSCGAGCTCSKCTQAMIACSNDPEMVCPKVIACANEHNCTGIDCYKPETCMAIIDAAPGGVTGSLGVALAGDVGNCIKPPMGAQICSPTCM